MIKKLLYLLALCVSLQLNAENTIAPDPRADYNGFDIAKAGSRYPRVYDLWDLRGMIGFSVVKPPYDWLENAYQAPYFDIRGKLGLPYNFSLEGEAQSLIVSNQIRLGPHYTYQFSGNKFSFDVGCEVAFDFGYMDMEGVGFNNSMAAWQIYPQIKIGYKLNDEIAFTLESSIDLLTTLKMRAGDQHIITNYSYQNEIVNGGTLAGYIEQRFFKDKVLIIGVKSNSVRFYYLTWPAFSTFNRIYNIPELYFGFIL